MTEEALREATERALAGGFVLAQEGRIIAPAAPGVSFADRAEGFKISLLGFFRPPEFRSQFQNALLDTDERWVHLRRPRQ